MGRLTSVQLSELAARRPAKNHSDEVITAVMPLVIKYARLYVQGFDEDDLRQEMLIVLVRCHSIYDTGRGSFLNLCIRSMENKMGHLRARARRNQPITGLRCRECGGVIPRRARGPECDCGGSRWDSVRMPYGHVSLESIVLVQPEEESDNNTGYMRFLGEKDEMYDRVDQVDLVQRVLAGDSVLQDIADRVLADDSVSRGEQDRLREAFTAAMRV